MERDRKRRWDLQDLPFRKTVSLLSNTTPQTSTAACHCGLALLTAGIVLTILERPQRRQCGHFLGWCTLTSTHPPGPPRHCHLHGLQPQSSFEYPAGFSSSPVPIRLVLDPTAAVAFAIVVPACVAYIASGRLASMQSTGVGSSSRRPRRPLALFSLRTLQKSF